MKLKKLHIIAPYPKGEAPSQRFRFEQYLSYFEQNGFEIHFHSFHTTKSWNRLYQPGKFGLKTIDLGWNFIRRWILLFQLIGAKHIFIHREMAHIGPPVFEWILAKVFRRKYTLDFDDAIWIPNYSTANARFQRLKCYWKTKHVMRWAATISAGNEFLMTYAKQFNSNVFLIPTTIDTEGHHNQIVNHKSGKIIIGWTGTHSTMRYLDPIIPVLEKLEKEFEFEFRVISNKQPSYQLKSLNYQDWKLETEIEDLARFHIGLMPLVSDQWSEGKCGFKALQYMALGSVAIVSPVGVNTSIVQNGENGFIANQPEEWESLLRKLLNDAPLREQIGIAARKSIVAKWSVKAWKDVYLNLLQP